MVANKHIPSGKNKVYSSFWKKRINVESEYFSRSEVGKIFGVSNVVVARWEEEGLIVRTFIPTREARYHQRELNKIADTIYGDPVSEENRTCTCRCKEHRPANPALDELEIKVQRNRAEERQALREAGRE
jgi:DNA-binding transcriptional MerR regulator